MSIGRTIKAELKKEFPTTKFSVRADYNSVKIFWTNGPSEKVISKIVGKYQEGRFDGMTDSYDYCNRRDDVPQVSYVFLEREISADIYESKFNEYKNYYLSWEGLTGLDDCSVKMLGYSPRGFIRHEMYEKCIPGA